ncbi:MAG: NAD-binding protein [Halobacteriales archaeon]
MSEDSSDADVDAIDDSDHDSMTELADHVIVLGYGDLVEPILSELDLSEVPFIVITAEATVVETLTDRGIRAIAGEPTDEASLAAAALGQARAVVAATNDDAQDALAILTARRFNPDVRIVAAAVNRENITKLKRAGASIVISPARIGGQLLVRSALGDTGIEELADRILGESI